MSLTIENSDNKFYILKEKILKVFSINILDEKSKIVFFERMRRKILYFWIIL